MATVVAPSPGAAVRLLAGPFAVGFALMAVVGLAWPAPSSRARIELEIVPLSGAPTASVFAGRPFAVLRLTGSRLAAGTLDAQGRAMVSLAAGSDQFCVSPPDGWSVPGSSPPQTGTSAETGIPGPGQFLPPSAPASGPATTLGDLHVAVPTVPGVTAGFQCLTRSVTAGSEIVPINAQRQP
jgi:hypothetical protein